MPATTTKKPTWSKVQSPKSKGSISRGKASRSKSKASHPSPAARRPPSKIAIPSHLQREITALLLLVGAALFALGLLSWSGGRQGVVGYMGGFLAQMFGVTAWLVPAALVMAAAVLFV